MCVCECVWRTATPVGNQVKHSIVDYMRFIYDFRRCHYEMFPLDFVLLSFLFDLLLLWVISYRSIGVLLRFGLRLPLLYPLILPFSVDYIAEFLP